MMNSDKLKYRSFILNVASLCHELIHYYDTHFGDGDELTRFCILTNNDLNEYSHRTLTFIEKQKLANLNYLNVITSMNKADKILDKAAIKRMIDALTPEEIKALKENDDTESQRQKHSILHID